MVFDPTFIGTVKLNGVAYTATSGIVIILNVPIGLNTITKGTTANLFYIKTVFDALGLSQNVVTPKLILYPNPVTNQLNIASDSKIEKVMIYSLTGELVRSIDGELKTIDISTLSSGNYFIKVQTEQGVFNQRIIKK